MCEVAIFAKKTFFAFSALTLLVGL